MRAALPDGLRIYAVGDLHGCLDLLRALYAKIAADIADFPPRESIEIFLGDYVDRGPQSAEVIDWLVSTEPVTGRRVCLKGNHEDIVCGAIDDVEGMPLWLANGGIKTLASYGVTIPSSWDSLDLARARAELLANLPPAHREFLRSLQLLVEFDPYAFVHAGVRPGVPLANQDPHDLMWIRSPFLLSGADFGRIVVHGHTPAEEPEVRPNRINIDTGAVFTGRLTCLVLEGNERRLLQAIGYPSV